MNYRLNLGALGDDPVQIVGRTLDGRLHVEFASGARLMVPGDMVVPLHRRNDKDTSIQAADAQLARLSINQTKVLNALAAAGEVGMLDHDHQKINGLMQDSAGKRRKELQERGLVRDSGIRRPSPRGPLAIVWCITEAGREWLAKRSAA